MKDYKIENIRNMDNENLRHVRNVIERWSRKCKKWNEKIT